MKKKIQFSLVYRDMWQSSGKFQPRKDQLERIAPAIIDMGCFSRVETNGGAFEQVNLLAGENPNDAVRAFCKPFNEVGIKTHMLDRGLNALRMYPVPDDVRRLMYKVKHAQGVDIPRIFCGLNDVRNIIPSVKWALEAGMTPQATLCITTSPIHTVEYYSDIADQVIAAGAQEICLKDMAGIGQPAMLGKLTKAIKTKHPDVIIQYHGHSGPGLSMASILEVCNNGGDVIDTAIEPLSWGKVHPDIISVQSMLKNEGFEVAEINMNAYMRARTLTQEFIDDWLGYFINPGNKLMSSLLLGCGLPGGMMGSMMADLAGVHRSINSILKAKGQPELSTDDLLVKLFDEVAYVWPRVGYPPLVTPFSQYVKNIALLNLLTMAQGKGRFVMMDDSMWGMILGKSGKIPGSIDPELIELAGKQGREFTEADPHTLIPDALDSFKTVTLQQLGLAGFLHLKQVVALITQAQVAVGRPAYFHFRSRLQFLGRNLMGGEKRRIVGRTGLQPGTELLETGMTDITRQHVERLHARQMRVAYISPQTFQRGGGHTFIHLALQMQGKLIEIGRSVQRLGVGFLYQHQKFGYFRFINIYHWGRLFFSLQS